MVQKCKRVGKKPTLSRLALAALTSASAVALSSAPAQAVDINHFDLAAGPHNYFVTNHPAVLPHLNPSAWLIGAYAHDPLVLRNLDGDQLNKIVEHRVDMQLAAALGLFDRFELALAVPAFFVNGPGFDGAGLTAASIGDPRIVGKYLITPNNEGIVASVRLEADLPLAQLNGAVASIAGDALPNVKPAVTVGYSSPAFRVALDAGYLLRAPSTIEVKRPEDQSATLLTVGHEVTYGAATEISLVPKTLFATVDLFGRIAPQALFSNRNQFPLEGVVGLKGFMGSLMLTGGVGMGLVPDYGIPDYRVFFGLGYYPLPEEKKVVIEKEPDPEPPKEVDTDEDGILDSKDACPEEPEDKDGYKDSDGCPEVDNDNDGIKDEDDDCPLEPEDKDRWQDTDGCADPDNDGDKILDVDDECPNDPETVNGVDDKDGCPDDKKTTVRVRKDRIEITDIVHFAYDSDRILPKSYELLDKVASVINEHTEIPIIAVEGHTDSDGNDEYNLNLSDRRAKSVMKYLIGKGVDASRLQAKGYGEQRPKVPMPEKNDAEKQENRRVEFRIVPVNDDGTEIKNEGGGLQIKTEDEEEEE